LIFGNVEKEKIIVAINATKHAKDKKYLSEYENGLFKISL